MRKNRPWWQWLLWLLLIVLLALALALGAALWWASTPNSLPRTLALAQKYLPADMSLQAEGVQGSITRGGTIERLQWQMPGTAVTLEDFRLDWHLAELPGRQLQVGALEAGRIHVRLTPQPEREKPATAFAMPANLHLPVQVYLPVKIGSVDIETVAEDGSATAEQIRDIEALYRYDGQKHALQLPSLHYQYSQLQADVQVDAQTLEMDAAVMAYLKDMAPGQPLQMLLPLTAKGTLAGGEAAALQLQLRALQLPADFAAPAQAGEMLQPAFAQRLPADDAALRLQMDAALHPWRAQPLQQAQVQLHQFNAADFHAAAPQTALQGSVQVQPEGQGNGTLADAIWNVTADIANPHHGPWDAQRLPLAQLIASAKLASDSWLLQSAQADLGAGSVALQGAYNPRQQGDVQLQAQLTKVNLQKLLGSLPSTELGGQLTVAPLEPAAPAATLAEASWKVEGLITNAKPGLVDRQQLPVRELALVAQLTPERWQAQDLHALVGDGRLQLQGHYLPQTQALQIDGVLQQLPLVQIHSQLAAEKAPALSGTLKAAGALQERVAFEADIASERAAAAGSRWHVRTVKGKGHWSPAELVLDGLNVDAFQAKVDVRNAKATLPDFSNLEAVLAAQAPGLDLNANAAMKKDSGGGELALKISSAERLVQWLGQLPVVGESLPRLQASGAADVQAQWVGGWQQWAEGLQRPQAHPQLRLNANAQTSELKLVLPAAVAPQADKNGKAQQTSKAAKAEPLKLDVHKLQASVQGNLYQAALNVQGDVTVNDARAKLQTQMDVKQTAAGNAAPVWNLTLAELLGQASLPGQREPWTLALAQGLTVAIAPAAQQTRISATAGRATLTPPASVAPASQALALEWQPLTMVQTAGGAMQLQSQGRISGIRPAWVDALVNDKPLKTAGISTNLVLNGQWNVDMGNALNVQASLQRESGDLWLGEPDVQDDAAQDTRIASAQGRRVAAGIRQLALNVRSQGEALQADLDWQSERAGLIDATVRTQLSRAGGGWTLAQTAPLGGQVKASFPELGVWGFVAPPGWRVRGALNADVAISGQVQQPQLQGSIHADDLNLRSVLDGVDLHGGKLRSTINGSRLTIAELSLQGGTGSRAYVPGLSGNRTQPPTERGRMVATGYVDWSGAASAQPGQSPIAMDVKARFEDMQVQVRDDRQVTLGGDLSAALQQGTLRVRGDLKVVRASITLPESGAPTLGSDVVVVRKSDPPAEEDEGPVGGLQTAKPMDMEVRLDMGRDFALQGYGITTRLEGDLTIRSQRSGSDPISIVGEIRTDEGRYRAWGQALNVETGIVMFNGPYKNPSINMLAIRPNIDVRAGVRVTGTAQAPRVKMYSEPDLPDAEKLSWVVLGRNPASGGAEGNAMQQAALGLLAGSVGKGLAGSTGFDEVGLSAEGVSVGKRLSDKLYVTYAASMSGAAGTLYVFYDISRKLTARGQTGEQSALDLIYTITYD